MTLVDFWFVTIAVLWTGFFVLEGFDFGVGMLHGVAGRSPAQREAAVGTIGPVWDGNEVWLVVAGAAMFAAFPGWYATVFSGFYLAVVLLLVALIVRGVSFEFRGKVRGAGWRKVWDGLLTGGSLLIPLLIGVVLGTLLHGVPIDGSQEFTGSLADLLTGYGLTVGVMFVLLSLLHGAIFLAMKTSGELRGRAVRLAGWIAPAAAVAVLGFAVWTHLTADRGVLVLGLGVAAVLAVPAAALLVARGREGWAFTATTGAIAACVSSLFVALYPRLMVSSTNPAFDLTVHNAASGSYALGVMTVVAVTLLPLVLLYQGWTYYVFRERVRSEDSRSPSRAPQRGSLPPMSSS